LPFYFWCPAFKASPHSFLTFAGHVTASQPREKLTPGPPRAARMQGVNLPLKEAAESLKLTLYFFAKPRQHIQGILPSMRIKARSFLLVYLPFQEGYHELVHPGMNLAIPKNNLTHAKNL